MKYKVGDRVKIQSLERYNKHKNRYGDINYGCETEILFTSEMSLFCGQVVTITRVRYIGCVRFYHLAEDKGVHLWVDGMFEGLVEEETKPLTYEETVEIIEAMQGIGDSWECPQGYQFVDENGNVINAKKIVLEKKKKEYTKGAKVRHKTKGMVETVVGLCKIKYMGAWVDGVIYEGNDTNTGEPMTFVRVKEDFENNFEVL